MWEIEDQQVNGKFVALLDWVESGAEVVLARRGKAVALVPPEPMFDRTKPGRQRRTC